MTVIDEIKKFVRDFNLNLLTNENKISIDISKRFNKRFVWRLPSRKLINSIIEFGGVLIGSKAIRCYQLNNKQLLDRRTNDWDFVVTQSIAFKICEKFNIDIIPGVDKVISIKNQRYWRHPDYSDAYRVGPVDIQIIIKDELPDYVESKGIRISSLSQALNEKVKLIDELNDKCINTNSVSDERKELSKHIEDMTRIIIRFNSELK